MRHLDYVCFYNRSGYAQAAQDYIHALKNSGQYDIHISLLHSAPDQMSMTQGRFHETVAMTKSEVTDDAIQIFHCIPDMQRRAKKKHLGVGFATFETFDPPKHWIDILNTNAAVICPSRFNCELFRQAGVKVPIVCIPHVIDMKAFHPNVEPLAKSDKFTFLFFGAWKRRKGWREVVEAYFREFKPSDNVNLLIKTDRLSLANRDITEIRKNMGIEEKDTPPISFETRILNEAELPRFVKNADCLISPTYGEGFGLPGLQCMALEVPVVITDFSGCTDYANEETSTLLKPSGFILYNEMDQIPQFRNCRWCQVSVADVQSKMRYALNCQDEIKKKAIFASKFVKENFNYNVAVNGFSELLNLI